MCLLPTHTHTHKAVATTVPPTTMTVTTPGGSQPSTDPATPTDLQATSTVPICNTLTSCSTTEPSHTSGIIIAKFTRQHLLSTATEVSYLLTGDPSTASASRGTVHSTATSTSAVNSTGSRSGAESPVGAAVGAVLGVLAAVTIIVTILAVIFVLWRKNSIRRSDGTIANPTYEGICMAL